MLFQGQAVDAQVTGDSFCEARLELFKMIVQDYRGAFKRSTRPARDQGFFLCGQMCDFLHPLLRRVVPRKCMPDECGWDALRSFDFVVGELLSLPDVMQKTEFRANALKVSRLKIKLERESGKKPKSKAVPKAVMRALF